MAIGQTAVVELRIDKIAINGRHRKQLGDIRSLADSIEAVGLLHPIVVDSQQHLVAGHRRIEACKLLGRDTIRATVARNLSEAAAALKAESDENTCRLEFSPSEAAAMQRALLPLERKEAAERKAQAKGQPRGTKKAEEPSGKKPERKADDSSRKKHEETRRSDEKSAAPTGYSASTLRKVAEIEASGYADLIDEMNRTRKVDRVLQKVKARKADESRKALAAKAEASLPSKIETFGVLSGDFREVAKGIADNSVSLIFTDPPYDRKTLPLYADMAKIADRVLMPGGSLICYLGQYQIGDVINLVSPHLRLWWTLACLHSGQSARMNEYGIVVKWKPMLWFVKGTRGDKQTFVDDLIESRQEKQHHDWQQSEVEAGYYIEKLTQKGEIVFDPFCGGGTTAASAKRLGRNWITCDVDESSVKLARKRVSDIA